LSSLRPVGSRRKSPERLPAGVYEEDPVVPAVGDQERAWEGPVDGDRRVRNPRTTARTLGSRQGPSLRRDRRLVVGQHPQDRDCSKRENHEHRQLGTAAPRVSTRACPRLRHRATLAVTPAGTRRRRPIRDCLIRAAGFSNRCGSAVQPGGRGRRRPAATGSPARGLALRCGRTARRPGSCAG
jgi:hypothetical protein